MKNLRQKLREKLKMVPAPVWILLAILAVGIFLRTYQFHNWLDFGSDQVNDANRVGAVVKGESPWPLLGPDMSNSGKGGRHNRFRLGPMYYYFEITSAKIFGNAPDKMAYPDMLFGILTIPLLYFFLKKYFSTNLTLALDGIYTISFYSLKVSHSAWNINSIPFFTVLFLLSVLEILVHGREARWFWVVMAGVALGVGVQLHAIMLVLLPALALLACAFSVVKDRRTWISWGAIFLLAVVMNTGQIISEYNTNFRNSEIFLSSVNENGNGGGAGQLLQKFGMDIDCHIESNAYMLTAIGQDQCDFTLTRVAESDISRKFSQKIHDPAFLAGEILSILFSFFGYTYLFYKFKREKIKEKKYFLGLVGIFSAVSFVVLLPVIDPQMRYFIHTFFVPIVFLGLAIDFLSERYSKEYAGLAIILIFIFLVASNLMTLQPIVAQLSAKERSGPDAIALGEMESMAKYMIASSGHQKSIYLISDSSHANFFKSLAYVAAEKNVNILRAKESTLIPQGEAEFYLGSPYAGNQSDAGGNKFDDYKNFSDWTGIYRLAP